mmetsp:Transcript_99494/g.172707  ORF Transcript_99494/g.172707 Transcript_99494/m.172707 type:complete len:182 (+) Transcript_99494:37-582(+)
MGARACTCIVSAEDSDLLSVPKPQPLQEAQNENRKASKESKESFHLLSREELAALQPVPFASPAKKPGSPKPAAPNAPAASPEKEVDVLALAASLAAPRPQATKPPVTADKGSILSPGQRNERRVDPADGRSYTWEQFEAVYRAFYKKREIHQYWQYTCRPTKLVQKKRASSRRAKAKAKP